MSLISKVRHNHGTAYLLANALSLSGCPVPWAGFVDRVQCDPARWVAIARLLDAGALVWESPPTPTPTEYDRGGDDEC